MGVAMGRVAKMGMGIPMLGREECTIGACERMNFKDPANVYRWKEEYDWGDDTYMRGMCVRNDVEVYCREGEGIPEL